MNGKLGLSNLLKKSIAVISAAISSLGQQAKAAPPPGLPADNDLNIEAYQKKVLASRLVLQLSKTNLNEGRVVMHTSHSSHSSHSSHMSSSTSGHYSHSSHSSHSSHFSSSPSYTPSISPGYSPSTTPYVKTPTLRIEKRTSDGYPSAPYSFKKYPSNSAATTLHYYLLGSRTLFKGCKGTDVKDLQNLLIALGYDLTADGYFGETTKVAVVDFQNNHDLTADGRVGIVTLSAIQNQ